MASWSAPGPVAAVKCSPPAAPRAAIASPSEVLGVAVADQCFRNAYRLRKTDEYSSVFAFRRAVKGRFFTVHYRPATLPTARLGVVVAKRLARRAVERNLVKRIAREAFRMDRAALPCLDLVVRLSAPVGEASRAEIRADLLRLLGRLPR